MDDAYENIHDYNSSRKRKIFIVFDDMIADIMTNKKFQAIKKFKFIIYQMQKIKYFTCFYYSISVPKDVRLNSTPYLIIKINNKRELQNIELIILQILIIKIL